jgi:hypothetical protein
MQQFVSIVVLDRLLLPLARQHVLCVHLVDTTSTIHHRHVRNVHKERTLVLMVPIRLRLAFHARLGNHP